MVPVTKVMHGIASYLDAELMPQFGGNTIERVVAGTAISLAIRKGAVIVDSYKDNQVVKMLGIMDDKGNIDIDVLSDELKKNVPKEGVKVNVPVIGTMTFTKDDIDTLHNYITNS